MKQFYFLSVTLLIAISISAQPLPDSITKKIDSLFIKWDNTNSPGCAVGIVRNDSLIYAKGYGMANLEYGIPITPETIFEIGSTSKQFTGYCILLLARQHKLALDDDIRKYLSSFPDLKEKITIRNLLNHTSGIQDFLQLLAIKGVNSDDALTSEMGMKILNNLQSIEFKPGDRFSYSNSNYLLLAEIIKSVSGKTLRQFADSSIFKPLQMISTHFHDNNAEIEKNRASSYERADGQLVNVVSDLAVPGPACLYTSINEMAKWLINFSYPKSGDRNDIEQLTRKGTLNDGKEILYASGIAVGNYKGSEEFYHEGGWAGYRAVSLTHPDLRLGVLIFSNDADFNVDNAAFSILDFFIPDPVKTTLTENIQKISGDTIQKDIAKIKPLVGNYIADDGARVSFTLKDDKLYSNANTLYENNNEQSSLLCKDSINTFSDFNNPAIKFSFSNDNKDSFVTAYYPWEMAWNVLPKRFKKYTNLTSITDQLLQTYTGSYYSSELDTRYEIILKNHNLILTHWNISDARLRLFGKDNLITDLPWIRHFRVIRNSKNQVIGLEENNGDRRVNHLKFSKTN